MSFPDGMWSGRRSNYALLRGTHQYLEGMCLGYPIPNHGVPSHLVPHMLITPPLRYSPALVRKCCNNPAHHPNRAGIEAKPIAFQLILVLVVVIMSYDELENDWFI